MEKKTLILTSGMSGSTNRAGRYICDEIQNYATQKSISKIDDISSYDRIIIGSPIYYGKWSKETDNFITNFLNELHQKEVFIFFTCLRLVKTGKEDYCQTMIYNDPNLDEGFINEDRIGMMEKSHSIDYYLSPIKDKLTLINPKNIGFFKGDLILKKLDFKSAIVMKLMSLIMKQACPGEYLSKSAIREWISLNNIE